MSLYPTYYRKGSVCIKREDPKTGKQVDLSEKAANKPFEFIHTPDKHTFDALVSTMEIVSFETYERYLILLHNKSKFEAQSFRDMHHRSPEYVNNVRRRSYE
jgi:hypothetical protein